MATKTKLSKTSQRKTESPSAPVLNFDPVIVKKVQAQMLEKKQLSAVSEFFKVLGDETRMKIINALAHEELCVSISSATCSQGLSVGRQQIK